MTTQPDPWAILRDSPHLRLVITQLPVGYRGLTDGHKTIWLSDRLTQRERRSTLMHELIHVERGHRGPQPANVELAVRTETARRLLPDIDALAAAIADVPLRHAALHLWVSDDVLRDRLATLDPDERDRLDHLFPIAC